MLGAPVFLVSVSMSISLSLPPFLFPFLCSAMPLSLSLLSLASAPVPLERNPAYATPSLAGTLPSSRPSAKVERAGAPSSRGDDVGQCECLLCCESASAVTVNDDDDDGHGDDEGCQRKSTRRLLNTIAMLQ
ncbi:hypothetical protein ACQY0O_004713 [Thecaphora frezii]